MSARFLSKAYKARFEGKGRPDVLLLGIIAVLIVIGVEMVYSSSFVIAYNSPLYRSDTYFLVRQLMWVGLGILCMAVLMRIDYHRYLRVTVAGMVIIILMLFVVVATNFGYSSYGAQRWLSLGPLPPVQPSEFAKLALILYLSDWLSRRGQRLKNFAYGALPFAVMLGLIAGLVLIQPDLGSAFVIVLSAICLFFIAGADLRHLFAGLGAGAIALVLAVMGAGYRTNRIVAFLDPEQDPLGVGWHVIQTNIALGSGGILGLGLGASRQKFYYLPNAHTDAIFAVIGEELGLVGTLTVLGLFAFFAYRGYRITVQAPDTFGAFLAAGITFWITFQALLNIAVATSTIPFTGITLPFISYGGSSMLVSFAAIGILLNVSRQKVGFVPEKNRNKGAQPAWGRVDGPSLRPTD
ncbi:MAG: putative lipid II flippase FtsW [Chloroflexi bacterium]|nr:putative lipid II flippase FtsW [Chloroflexota bacterium]